MSRLLVLFLCIFLSPLFFSNQIGLAQDIGVVATEKTEWNDLDLANAITKAIQDKKSIILPKKIVLTETVNLRKISGIKFEGAGKLYTTMPDNAIAPVGCPIIEWKGPEDKPIFRMEGIGNVFEGFHVTGKCRSVFHVVKGNGIGSGKHTFQNISAVGVGYLVEAGELIGDGNCDVLAIYDCIVNSSTGILRSNNNQSMGHTIRNVITHNCDVCLDIRAGGFVNVDGWTSSFDKLILNLGLLGRNNGYINIENIKIDSQSEATQWRLVQGQPNSSCNVYISGLIGNRASRIVSEVTSIFSVTKLNLDKLIGLK